MNSFWSTLLVAVGSVITIIDVLNRYGSVSKKIDEAISALMKKIRPSHLKETIDELQGAGFGLPVVLLIMSFLLYNWSYDHSPLAGPNIVKMLVAIVVLIIALFVAVLAVCFIVFMAASIAFAGIGFYFHISHVLTGGKHLAFAGIPMAITGMAQLFIEHKISDGLFAVFVVALSIVILEYAIRNTARKSYWPFLLEEMSPLVINVLKGSGIIVLASLAILGYWIVAHQSLYRHNETVEWKTPLQQPINLGNVKVTDIEFGLLTHRGTFDEPVVRSIPLYELNDKKRSAIAFAVKFDKPVGIYACHFVVHHVDSTGKKKMVLNQVYAYEGDLGWSVNIAPFFEIKELDSLNQGHLDVFFGIGPAYKDSIPGKFLYVARGKLAIYKKALLPENDIQKWVLVTSDSLGHKKAKFVEESN